MENLKTNKIKIIVFPEKSGVAIVNLLKKHGLKKNQDMVLNKLINAKEYKEKMKIAEEIPSRKIATTLKQAVEQNLTHDDLASKLKNGLGITKEKAEDLSTDLENQILSLVKKEFIEGYEESDVSSQILPSHKTIEPSKKIDALEKTISPEKPKRPKKADVYREPME
ncbi:MAG: hypothetical protein ABH831_00135 [Candidatus Nealsonbacteria bacterium]